MIKNDLSLEHIFAYLDKDKSQAISIEEVTRGFQSILNDAEILKLFMTIDSDGSKSINYEELVVAFKDVHTNYILHKLKQAITMGNLTPEKVFNAVDVDSSRQLDVVEFN
jgi:Ca2+-binding EF-hand superfamily protein